MITLNKLIKSENYLPWADFIELWFIGNSYEDHLITPETSIAEDKHSQAKG